MALSGRRFQVIEAEPKHIHSLKTIFSRSFHPLKEFHRIAQPDTPTTREWWGKVQTTSIDNPKEHVLVVIDSSADDDEVYGVLNMRRFEPGERGIGLWSEIPLSEDQDKEMCSGFIDYMLEWREKLMVEQPHYLIELFGVDHSIQRQGLGKMLLGRATQIMDEEGVKGFVEAGSDASAFYPKFGFSVEDHRVLSGKVAYDEYILVRQPVQK